MSTPLISVVIPCYNAAPFLSDCIKSIDRAAKGHDVEIICVDDGSTDETAAICRDLKQSFPAMNVISQPNGGPSGARATGVKHSRGQWIMFVDADDTLPANAVSDLIGVPDIERYDIVVGNKKGNSDESKVLDIEDYRKGVLRKKVPPYPWGKLFRRSLFDDDVFDLPRELIHGEDLIMNVRLAFNSSRPVFVTKKKVYDYNFVASSLSHTFKYTTDYEQIFDRELKRSIKSENPEYMHILVRMRIKAWKRINRFLISTRRNRDTDFYRDLCADIRKSAYRLDISERCNVYGNDVFTRSLIIIFEHLPHHLQKKIKALRAPKNQ